MKEESDEIVNKLRLNRPRFIKKEISPIITLVKEMNEQANIVIVILHWGLNTNMHPQKIRSL
jgi:poly-gamma-glutamate capsule biosynthesis protein CapA/YwtB (metallophosphatase superfamily)